MTLIKKYDNGFSSPEVMKSPNAKLNARKITGQNMIDLFLLSFISVKTNITMALVEKNTLTRETVVNNSLVTATKPLKIKNQVGCVNTCTLSP